MILIDTNIFMYAAGGGHPCKKPSEAFIRSVASGETEACIDAEVLQEVLHRYRSIDRWEDGKRLFQLVRRIVPMVQPISGEILDRSCLLMEIHPHLMARDAIHVAICQHIGAEGICSYDKDLDRIPEIKRFMPEELVAG